MNQETWTYHEIAMVTWLIGCRPNEILTKGTLAQAIEPKVPHTGGRAKGYEPTEGCIDDDLIAFYLHRFPSRWRKCGGDV